MKKLFWIIIFVVLFKRMFWPIPVLASETAGTSAVFINMTGDGKIDIRELQLREFLTFNNSPLSIYSRHFVQTADKYGIDWRLMPAISGVESTFGKNIPLGSYNAYGWNNGNTRFSSWEESIEIVGRTLSEKYYKRGLNTPQKIAPIYCPPSKVWAKKVTYFMEKLDGFENKAEIYFSPLLM